jgi:hypothetical protein
MHNDPLTTTIIQEVHAIYAWLDQALSRDQERIPCQCCGQCCDFHTYDHQLFVTTPELIHFQATCPEPGIHPMTEGRCPYNENGKCTVYAIRFSACRIFSCQGNPDKQAQLSERTLAKLKRLCDQYHLDYRYMDLATALTTLVA